MHFAKDREIMVSFGTDMHSTAGAVERGKANAKRVSEERAQYKRDARELMKDEEAASNLPPIGDFEYYKNKYSQPPHNLSGDKLWETIILQGKVTNKEYNNIYGKNKK